LVYLEIEKEDPMKTINIQAAKTHLSRLVDEVVDGAEVVLAKSGKPLVRLVPYKAPGSKRRGGQFAGQVWESDDCWSDDEGLAASIEAPLYVRVAKATVRGGDDDVKVAEGGAK